MENSEKDRLKLYLPEYMDRVTQKSKSGKYVCPFCGSGTKGKGTGGLSITENGTKWYCFACGRPSEKGGDLFDLIGLNENLDASGAFKRARELYGAYVPEEKKSAARKAAEEEKKPAADTSAEIAKARGDLAGAAAYLKSRGISMETASRHGCGYVEKWRHPKNAGNEKIPLTPRLIVPNDVGGYLARDTRPEANGQYVKQKVKPSGTFNIKAVESTDRPVFVVEGEIDCMSVEEAGGICAGLGSTSNKNAFMEYVKAHKPVQPLILLLDGDTAGRECQSWLKEELERAGVCSCEARTWLERAAGGQYELPEGEAETEEKHAERAARLAKLAAFKDPNEMWTADPSAFTFMISGVERWAATEAAQAFEDREEERKAEYLRNSCAFHVDAFLDGVKASASVKPIHTGYIQLDEALSGGLREGLYIIGALSSMGKTSYLLQMTDQIAAQGVDVLYISLEQKRYELMAKSISRNTMALQVMNPYLPEETRKAVWDIMDGSKYKNYTVDEKAVISEAVENYRSTADHVYIIEGREDMTTDTIRKAVEDHVKFTGNRPVVVVDYLQILAPYNERMTDKRQLIDHDVRALKLLSGDYKIPVIAVSSFNRGAYSNNNGKSLKLAEECFKESGGIEYSADVLMGLNYKKAEAAGNEGADMKKEGRKDPREVQLVIIKNRNGQRDKRINYLYYSAFNYFDEQEEAAIDWDTPVSA